MTDKEEWLQRTDFADESIDLHPWRGLQVDFANTIKHETVKFHLSQAIYERDRGWDSEVEFPNGRVADIVDLGPEDEKAVVYEVETDVTPQRKTDKLNHFYHPFDHLVRDVIVIDPETIPDHPERGVEHLLDNVVIG